LKSNNFKISFFIAWRYLFSKKKHNLINIIALLSTVGVCVCSAALVIVLSVFNGMEQLIVNNLNSINPDIQIELSEGKSFITDSFPLKQIIQIEGVASCQKVISDAVLVSYEEKQTLVKLKGVSESYFNYNHLSKRIIDGKLQLGTGTYHFGLVGVGIASILQINLNSYSPIHFYYPKRTKKNLASATNSFNEKSLIVSSVFASNTQYDEDFIFCKLSFAETLMEYQNEATAMEVFIKDKDHTDQVCKKIKSILGQTYSVKDRYQQEELTYKTMKSEKLMIFVILSFILLIATFNIIGSIGMLMVEKREDLTIFNSFGTPSYMIKQIFIMVSFLISFFGGIIGIVLGAVISFVQETFHLVSFGNDATNFIINYYPVAVHFNDLLLVFGIILLITFFSSRVPMRLLNTQK
jgi:ABC-type lipoprotein release transport system permease subunit